MRRIAECILIICILFFVISCGSKGEIGEQGPAGNGIVSIEKTATDGNVDTYTIYFTNGTTSTFTITNVTHGSQGEYAPVTGEFDFVLGVDGKSYVLTGYSGADKFINIPSSYNGYPVIAIDYNAFNACNTFSTIYIPDSITSIGEQAFFGCGITSITIPESVTSIGNSAFCNCSSLTSITIPNGVTSIKSYAFKGCSSLTSITIPNSVTSIEQGAFAECTSLQNITIPNNVTNIGDKVFSECRSLTSITIPNGVINIGYSAFGYCKNLTSITIPDSVTSIGGSSFEGCSSLRSITIPNSVTGISYSAFNGCGSLKSIIIPNSVIRIGENAFKGCISLSIYCEATSLPPGWNINWNVSNCPVVWGYTGN